MSYLDILRRVEQGNSPMPDSEGPQNVDPASLSTKKEKSCPLYWQSMDGVINGPAVLDHLHLATDVAGVERCWFCLSYRGRLVWVREDLLRKVEGE
ncbi:hypothetical protein DNFV4_01620 [Nitrospira tepida]|uniref:Uncharacterized protein n=1 Tax=Nitrospira tepida TaxID=2973512 RepID=A0AA86MYC9_9BACT|nr:hypothetical protein DNFV4_01620 [Nitrospira tepida]